MLDCGDARMAARHAAGGFRAWMLGHARVLNPQHPLLSTPPHPTITCGAVAGQGIAAAIAAANAAAAIVATAAAAIAATAATEEEQVDKQCHGATAREKEGCRRGGGGTLRGQWMPALCMGSDAGDPACPTACSPPLASRGRLRFRTFDTDGNLVGKSSHSLGSLAYIVLLRQVLHTPCDCASSQCKSESRQ